MTPQERESFITKVRFRWRVGQCVSTPHNGRSSSSDIEPGIAPFGMGSPLSNGANGCFSDGDGGGAKSPVDLPLRLDDANASPTTPQGQRQYALISEATGAC